MYPSNYITSVENVSLNKKYSFTIFLKSERPQSDRLIRLIVDAVVAPIQYDLIIDIDTIKNNDLVAHFPSHFVKGPLLDRILSMELPSKKRSLDTIIDTQDTELNNSVTQCLHKRALTTSKPTSLVSLASIRVSEQRSVKT